MSGPKRNPGVDWDTVRRLAANLPGAEEGTSYGTPAFKVKGKLFARLREDGTTLVIKIEPEDRAARLRLDPEAYYLTDHYEPYPYMLARMGALDEDDLAELLEHAWRMCATKKLIDQRERGRGDA